MPYKICDSFVISGLQIMEVRNAAEKHPLELAKTKVGSMIARKMRAACPVSGDSWDRLITVLLPIKGRPGVPPHAHQRHLIMYYPEACEVVVIDGDEIIPTRGMMIYAPPLTLHAVPPVTKPRLSVAMLVSDEPS